MVKDSFLHLSRIHSLIGGALDDVACILEEERYNPSIREAGSSPTDQAMEDARQVLMDLINGVQQVRSVKKFRDVRDLNIEEVLLEIVQDMTADNHEIIFNAYSCFCSILQSPVMAVYAYAFDNSMVVFRFGDGKITHAIEQFSDERMTELKLESKDEQMLAGFEDMFD